MIRSILKTELLLFILVQFIHSGCFHQVHKLEPSPQCIVGNWRRLEGSQDQYGMPLIGEIYHLTFQENNTYRIDFTVRGGFIYGGYRIASDTIFVNTTNNNYFDGLLLIEFVNNRMKLGALDAHTRDSYRFLISTWGKSDRFGHPINVCDDS